MSVDKKKQDRRIGPGGMNCVCCGPAPGKSRKAFMRMCKRARRQEVRQEIRQQLKETKDD